MPVAGVREPPAALATPAPGRGDQRKRITVLFADLAGSTAMQEALDPEVVRRLMGRWSSAMRTAIERHGGLIDHFAGDGIVATWGVQALREDDARRALTGAWAMRTALATINDEIEPRYGLRLRMRVGVHTGDVVVSAEGFLVGDTMNTTARLEQNAPEGEILVGPLTYQLVRHHAELRAVVFIVSPTRNPSALTTTSPVWTPTRMRRRRP
jgi:class 3 adenylate cyclase